MRATISRRSPTIASSSVIASVARSCGSGRSSARFQRLVLQPGDVELVRPLGNLGRVEATEAAGLAQVFALRLALAVRVGAVALLELGEVLRAERSVLLRDARDVAPRVEDPDILPATTLIFLCPEGLPAKRGGLRQEQQVPVLLHEYDRRLELKAPCATTT